MTTLQAKLTNAFNGETYGPNATRKVHLCESTPSNGCIDDANRFVVFAFGAYASTYVAVPCEAHDSVEDALEVAAELLAEVAPGVFTTPDYDAARDEITSERQAEMDSAAHKLFGCSLDDLSEGQVSECAAYVGHSAIAEEAVAERAEADLTYTESGFIASWEWAIVSTTMTAPRLVRFAKGEEV